MRSETLLKHYVYEKYILEIAIATLERGGVTSKVDTYQFLPPIDAWGLPKYPAKTVVLLPGANIVEALKQFIQVNRSYLQAPDAWLGTWVNPETECCYLDITVIYPCLEDAMKEALELSKKASRKIEALYNFKHDQTVYLWKEQNADQVL